jgi:hypothetical protein
MRSVSVLMTPAPQYADGKKEIDWPQIADNTSGFWISQWI